MPDSTLGLLAALRPLDEAASALVSDATCEWVRFRSAIVGIVVIPPDKDVAGIRHDLRTRVSHAHALLDALPVSALTPEDIWNLILLISLPWKREEVDPDTPLAAVLQDCARNTAGSRKILLWRNETPRAHFGPLLEGSSAPARTFVQDPLRDELYRFANTSDEQEALELIFKSRIVESDIDDFIRALGEEDV